MQDFFTAINDCRPIYVKLSDLICVDEIIYRWYGLDGEWIETELPHYVSIDQKPEIGYECKSAAYGISEIMFHLDIAKCEE